MNVFDMHITLQNVLEHYPELSSDTDRVNITKALIYTRGSLEDVEFLTDASKTDIIHVYKLLRDINVVGQSQIPPVAVKTPKQRSFKRTDMVNYLKLKLLEQHPSLEFLQLKYNVLTCKLGERVIKIYISTSRDYESLKDEDEYQPNRVSGWHKGERTIFTNEEYHYFALLTKIDDDSKYSTDSKVGIEGMLISFQQMQDWLNQKSLNNNQMINYYVHYTQIKTDSLRTKANDAREEPHLDLTHFYNQPFALNH